MSPEELVGRAKRAGLGVLAVTDHDTMAGVDSAVSAGAALGQEIMTELQRELQAGGYE